MLSAEEARKLLDSIETTTLIGLRDRALIGVMVYSFARVGAAVTMRVGDYFQHRKRLWLRLHEKGGKRHEVPCHPTLEGYLDAYIKAAGIAGDNKGRLFRSMHKGDKLTDNAHEPVRRLPDDKAAGEGGRPPLLHLLPHVQGHRDHDLPPERRHARARPDHREP